MYSASTNSRSLWFSSFLSYSYSMESSSSQCISARLAAKSATASGFFVDIWDSCQLLPLSLDIVEPQMDLAFSLCNSLERDFFDSDKIEDLVGFFLPFLQNYYYLRGYWGTFSLYLEVVWSMFVNFHMLAQLLSYIALRFQSFPPVQLWSIPILVW